MSGYDQSLADLLRSTIHDAQDLVRGEIALAKSELREEIRRFGAGVVALAVAAAGALVAVVFLLMAVAWAIPSMTGWAAWTGFAVVGALVLAIALALAMMARSRFTGARHMPLTVDMMKENVQWTRARKL